MSKDSDNSDNESTYDSDTLDTDDFANTTCIFEDIVSPPKNTQIEVCDKKDRVTRNYLTTYEMVRIIGERTKQLTMGAKALIIYDKNLTYEQIAIEELKLNAIPFKIKRYVPNHYEIWDLEELNKDHLSMVLD